MFQNNLFLIAYLGGIGIVGVFLLWWLRKKVTSVEDQRVTDLDKVKRFDAVRTRTPFKNPFKKARRYAQKRIEHRFSIIKRTLLYLVLVLWSIAVILPFLHSVPATLLSLITASFTVFIGIAARPYVENMISGIVISFSQHLRVGDTVVVDNRYGTVEDISLTHTIIKKWDWRRYIIPNSRMIAKEFLNLSLYDPFVWTYVEFWVEYTAKVQQVQEIAVKAVSASRHFANYEQPECWVMDMDQSGFMCWVVGWADSPADAWMLKHEIQSELIKAFQAASIKTHSYQVHLSQ